MAEDNPFNLTERQRERLAGVCDISPGFAIHVGVCLWDEQRFMEEYPIPTAMKRLVLQTAELLKEPLQ